MGKLLGNLSMAIRHIAILGDDSEFQRYHTNQACYKSGIMPPNIKGHPHPRTMNRCAVPICSIVTREGDFNHEANIVVWKPLHVI